MSNESKAFVLEPLSKQKSDERPRSAAFSDLPLRNAWKDRAGCSIDGLRAEINSAMHRCFQASRPKSAASFFDFGPGDGPPHSRYILNFKPALICTDCSLNPFLEI